MSQMHKPYGVYLGEQFIIAYETETQANHAADFATNETGVLHTVGPAPQLPESTKPFGVYLGDEFIIAYETETKANHAADFATEETGVLHEVKPAQPSPEHTKPFLWTMHPH